jgi:hypothetical protein
MHIWPNQNGISSYCYKKLTLIIHDISTMNWAGHSGHVFWGIGLDCLLAHWDHGFESHKRHECLSSSVLHDHHSLVTISSLYIYIYIYSDIPNVMVKSFDSWLWWPAILIVVFMVLLCPSRWLPGQYLKTRPCPLSTKYFPTYHHSLSFYLRWDIVSYWKRVIK